MTKLFSFLIIGCFSMSLHVQGMPKTIERVEPAFWWVGMQESELQLLVYGADIAAYTPVLEYDGVKIARVERVENKNYLFVYLNVAPKTHPGSFDLVFKASGKEDVTHRYELRTRSYGAAMLSGFDASDIIYLITPDRFANGDTANDEVVGMKEGLDRKNKGGRHGGDLAGIIQNLDYFQEMGMTVLWLNPILENNMDSFSYHGYSTTDYYRVDPRYGSNEEYLELAQKARERGIKIIMDMIPNHCGSEHWWMKDLPSKDWINNGGEYVQTSHEHHAIQDPYVSQKDYTAFVDGWFVPTMPDLNQKNPHLAKYLIQNSIWWIEYLGLGGIRIDTYPYADKQFLRDWSCSIMQEYPAMNLVGEEWNVEPAVVAYWQHGTVQRDGYTSCLPSMMDFPVQDALVKALNEEESWGTGWLSLYRKLSLDFLYGDAYNLVVIPDNHDMSRIFTQINENYDLYRLAISFVMTTRGIPQLYYGTEILMSDRCGDHGIIRSDFPGGWAGDEVNAFTGEGLSAEQQQAKEFVKQLALWRKKSAVIHTGKLMHFRPKDGVYTYFRYNELGETVMVVLSKNDSSYTLDCTPFAERLTGFSSGRDVVSGKTYSIKTSLEVPPHAALILELKK